MKYTAILVLTGIGATAAHAATANRPRLPYTFEQNQGQAPATVKFLARGEGYSLFLTEREAVLALSRDRRTQQVIRMSLDGSRTPQAVQAIEPSSQSTNYFTGSDRSQWKTNVPHFHRVRYTGVYDGVDLVYHGAENQLEYDFVLAPHASADVIQVRFDGADQMRVTPSGALELRFGARKLLHQAPVAYQEVGGVRRSVTAAYRPLGKNRIGFRVGAHDPSLPLVIDPVVVYSTFLGGDRSDTVSAVAVDAQGNTYVTGETTSTNFPVVASGITQTQGAVVYSFVTKFNAAGNAIVYSTYLGGASNTRGYAIAVDQNGNVFTAGVTGARNFPLVNPVQTIQPGLNIGYVAKLNPQGNALLFSTYIGGERNDEVRSLVLGPGGNIHVAGRVSSAEFPTANALQPTFGGSSDAFVAVYAAPNYRLAYSTFLGGTSAEEANALTVDAAGNTYVTGFAQGAGKATPGAYQTTVASPNDVFVAKINAAGSQLEWLTYFGGRGDDKGNAIALDLAGNVLVGGSATSNNLATTPSAIQPALRGDSDAFLARFSATGRELLYATYLGSNATRTGISEVIHHVAVDPLGGVTIAGVANGADFPAVRPIQSYGGGSSDGFVARLNASLTNIEFSTPVGGSGNDSVLGMALDSSGGVRLGGETVSADFPLKNAFRSTFSGGQEGFVSHICDPYLIASAARLEFTYETGKAVPPAQNLQISACAPTPYQVQTTGSFFSATPQNAQTNSAVAVTVQPLNLEPGVYEGQIRITAPDAVNSPITVAVVLRVTGPPPAITAAGIVHAATALGGPVAPGELLVIYGSNLGPKDFALAELDAQGCMPAVLKETAVYFDGVPGRLIYTSAGQISVVVPYEVAGRATTRVEVAYLGARSNAVTMGVAETAPGIFTANSSGTGQGALLNQGYIPNDAQHPARRGSVIQIYATGEGQTDPGGVNGVLAGNVLPKPLAPVSVTIGGVTAQVLYAGAAPGLVSGIFQINAVVPEQIAAGAAELRVNVGGAASRPGVTVAVQ